MDSTISTTARCIVLLQLVKSLLNGESLPCKHQPHILVYISPFHKSKNFYRELFANHKKLFAKLANWGNFLCYVGNIWPKN